MPSLKQRIAELFRDQPTKRPAHLAAYLHISRASVSNWVSGKTKTIKGDNAFAVAKFFGCNAEWVQSGKGKKYPTQKQLYFQHAPEKIQYLPLVPFESVATWCRDMNSITSSINEWFPCQQSICGPHAFALRVPDDSMTSPFPGQRSYLSGSVLFIDPDKEPAPGCRVIAVLFGDILFREYRKDGGKLILTAFNPQYQAHEATDDVQILGVVVGQYVAE